MKLPNIKKIKIGSSWYDVKYVNNLKDGKGKLLFGRIWQDTHIIEIDKKNSYQRTLQALLHESIHGICWEYIIEEDEDSGLVEPISNGLYAFIIDNPGLVKEILKHAERIKGERYV